MEDDIVIRLSADQALVLSDWLDRVEHTAAFGAVVHDRAVWSALLRISGTLDTSVAVIFASDYKDRLAAARERLLDSLGDAFLPDEP